MSELCSLHHDITYPYKFNVTNISKQMQDFQLIFKTQNSFFMRLIANYKRHMKKNNILFFITSVVMCINKKINTDSSRKFSSVVSCTRNVGLLTRKLLSTHNMPIYKWEKSRFRYSWPQWAPNMTEPMCTSGKFARFFYENCSVHAWSKRFNIFEIAGTSKVPISVIHF